MELQTTEFYDEMQTVVSAMLKGNTNPTALARELGMPRKKVLDYMDAWRDLAVNNPNIQDRALESLMSMDKHYDMIIKEMWTIVETEDDNKIRSTVLKNLADVEAKRQETLQKAGLFEDANAAIGDEMADMEAKAEAIQNLLKEVARQFPNTRTFIMEGLADIFGQGGSVPTDTEIIKGELTNGT